jgi:FkbM family methyltransferase
VISFAQNAEDVVLWRLFSKLERPGFFVDVGAALPVLHSVTKWFSLNGWGGVNIEPVPRLFAQLAADRPNEVNLNVACGPEEGTTTIMVAVEAKWGLSSMDPTIAARLVETGIVDHTTEVEMVTLSSIIERYAPESGVDFLKIDVEGAEAQVIAGAELSTHRPRVLIIEATDPDSLLPNHERWEHFVLESGYTCCLFDGLNRFYCRSDDEEALHRLQAPANVLDEYYVTYREYVLQMAIENLARLLPSWSEAVTNILRRRPPST